MKLLPFLTWCHRSVLLLKVPKNAWFALQVVKKKHLTVVFSATGDGKMLPPMIIFKEKTISDLNILAGFIVKTRTMT